MNPDLPVAVFKLFYRKCVIKILCISRIDCKRRYLPEVPAGFDIIFSDFSFDLFSISFNLFSKMVRKFKFCKDGMHLCFVQAGITKYIDNLSDRIL